MPNVLLTGGRAPATLELARMFQRAGHRALAEIVRRESIDLLVPTCEEIYVVPHQPSLVGLRAMQTFGWPADRIMVTLDRLGNCVAASIPATLYEAARAGRLARGDEVLRVGTGAGLSLGGAILTY